MSKYSHFSSTGLSGGSLFFDPTSLALKSSEPLGNFRLLTQQPNSVDWGSQPSDDRARVLHERDHLVRSLGTSFGVLRHAVNSLLLADAIQYFAATGAPSPLDPPLMHPLSTVLSKIRGYRGDTARLTRDAKRWPEPERILLRYHARTQFLAALDGESVPWPRHCELGLGLTDASLLSLNLPRLKGVYASSFSADEFTVWPNIDGYYLTSRQMFETIAVEVEMLHAFRFGRPRSTATNLLDHADYILLATLFDRRFRSRGTTKVPIDFDAIVDLALWVPMTLGGPCIEERPWQWTDFEPGYRFCKLLGWLEDRGIKPWVYAEDAGHFEECDVAMRRIQEEACCALGWPSPVFLATRLIDELTQIDVRQTTSSGYAVLGDRSPRLEWSIKLMKEFVDAPYSRSYRPFEKLSGSPVSVWFPCGVFADKDFAIDGLMWTDPHSPFVDYQVFTTLRMLMEGPIDRLMPRQHAQMGCRLIGSIGSDMLGDTSFLSKMENSSELVRKLPAAVPPYTRPR